MKTIKPILPKGKFNGSTIEGFTVQFSLRLLRWRWRPYWAIEFEELTLIWLCFRVRIRAEYFDF